LAGFNDALDERDTAVQLEMERARMAEEEPRRELKNYKV